MVSNLVYVAGSGAVPIVVLGLDAFSTVGRALQCPDSRGGASGRGRRMSSHIFIAAALFGIISYQVPRIKP